MTFAVKRLSGMIFSRESAHPCTFYVILTVYRLGGDLASTWVAKPEVHAENENSRKSGSLNINANDENFVGEANLDEAIAA